MPNAVTTEVSALLGGLHTGDPAAADRLMPLVYDQLRALAQSYLARERPGHTLQATALVNEAYMRLVNQTHANWAGRAHFLAVAAEMIRRILVDYARARHAAKRGGEAERITLSEADALATPPNAIDLIALDDAMRDLAQLDARQARVVELRFYGGLSVEETAHVLDVSPRTVKSDWRVARAWLRHRLLA